MSEDFGPWFHRFRPAERKAVTLFCFPHAGGAATSFLRLSRELAPDVEVLAVQYPGRQDRFGERCVESIIELAASIAPEVARRTAGTGPYALLGHSMGATVAFETARLLERDGTAPLALFASGRSAPASGPPLPGDRPLDDDAVLADIRRLGGTSTEVLDDPRMLAVLLPALRADYRAVRDYRYTADHGRRPLNCRITALVGDADPRITPDQARAWAEYTTGEFALHQFPGGHFYLDENLASVAVRIRSLLLGEVRV